MGGLLSILGLIALWAFGLFVTFGLWTIGLASFLQWIGAL